VIISNVSKKTFGAAMNQMKLQDKGKKTCNLTAVDNSLSNSQVNSQSINGVGDVNTKPNAVLNKFVSIMKVSPNSSAKYVNQSPSVPVVHSDCESIKLEPTDDNNEEQTMTPILHVDLPRMKIEVEETQLQQDFSEL
jgi:hypothetical protein